MTLQHSKTICANLRNLRTKPVARDEPRTEQESQNPRSQPGIKGHSDPTRATDPPEQRPRSPRQAPLPTDPLLPHSPGIVHPAESRCSHEDDLHGSRTESPSHKKGNSIRTHNSVSCSIDKQRLQDTTTPDKMM